MSTLTIVGNSILRRKFASSPPFVAAAALWCFCGCSLGSFDYLQHGASHSVGGATSGVGGQANQASGGDTQADSTANGGTISGGGATADAGGADDQGGAGGGTTDGVTVGGSASGGKANTSGGSTTGGATMTIGAAGAAMTAAGIAVLTVPLTAVGQGQRYNWENKNSSGLVPANLAGATMNIVACAPGATAGNLHIFFSAGVTGADSPSFDVALSQLNAGFETISIPVPDAVGSFDPTSVLVTRIEVEAGTGFGTSWQTPATIVYIDSISTSNGVFKDNFDTAVDYGVLATSGVRSGNGTVTWVGSYTWEASAGGSTSTGQGGAGGGSASSGGTVAAGGT